MRIVRRSCAESVGPRPAGAGPWWDLAMNPVRYVLVVVVVLIGIAAIVFGEADDSPGLQGLGALLAIGAIVLAVRAARRRP
ncbi:hypothetical protein GCM10020358_22570 [Amorphoplanes nipponensis]|uniref:Uncharacterized protein n=2 Tax=Actinoplanes nipponensis TaxID=135950 RepID=A0A919MP44_9ACTN|nr:hypothetical protein Ani05nite_26620 [Actinoplanes nipponensis]